MLRPDADPFIRSGRESVRELERTLDLVGRTLDSFQSILDFGCGCGRMLLWLEALGRATELHGTDIDAEAIAWCESNIPYAHAKVNSEDPPLPYPDGTFDLVFNHSVFTHIDERRQDLWLTELRRVTRPGGLLVLSVHGERTVPDTASELRDRLQQDGIAFLEDSLPEEFPLPNWYQTTVHAPWYVFEHWGRWFRIRAYIPGAALEYQDHVLLERMPDDDHRPLPILARPAVAIGEGPASRAQVALAHAQDSRETATTTPSRFGRLGQLSRAGILRALRPYSAHEDYVDAAVVASIAELSQALDDQGRRIEALERRSYPHSRGSSRP